MKHHALVLGGSGGLGHAIARVLARDGFSLRVHGRRQARVAGTVDELRSLGAEATGLPFNFMDASGAPRPAAEWPLHELLAGPVDTLVLAFGPFVRKPLDETSAREWLQMASLDLALPGAIVSAALPQMRSQGYGRILLCGSAGTDQVQGYRTVPAYAAAKTGLSVLAESVNADDADIRCTVLCPGFVRTEYYDDLTVRQLVHRYGPMPEAADLAERILPCLQEGPCQHGVYLRQYTEYGPWG